MVDNGIGIAGETGIGSETGIASGTGIGNETAALEQMWSSLRVQLDAHRPGQHSGEQSAEFGSLPVTILTGFLGSGKSTLLVDLLAGSDHGLRVRAVVNDVGSLPFDPTLITAANDVEVELNNGCGCCVSTTDLAASLDRLAESLLDETTSGALIVLEASGVADPLALAQMVEANPKLRVDRIVAAVDGQALEQLQADPGLRSIVARQLDAAHCIVVTHADRLTEMQRRDAMAAVIDAAPGRVVSLSTLASPTSEILTPSAVRGARLPVEAKNIEHGLTSLTVTQTQPLERARLERTVATRPTTVVRGKGRLLLEDGYHYVQFTPTTVSVTSTEAGPCAFTVIATTSSAASSMADLIVG